MKKIMIIILALVVSTSGFGQKKFKFEKLSKDVKKEAKRYEKQGYTVFAGKPPLSQQLNNAFIKQAETDDQGFPKWIIANGTAVAQTEAAAIMQATELAKINLVSLIETNMKSVVEADVSNNQISAEEAASITKTIQVSTNTVSKKLGMVNPLFQIKRTVNKNTEVQLMVGYNYDVVRQMMIDEMKVQLEKETEDVRGKYDNFLNPDTYKQGEIKNYADPAKQD